MKLNRCVMMSATRIGNEWGSGEPFQRLLTEPVGDVALINDGGPNGVYQIRRIVNGVSTPWTGSYRSLDRAQDAVESEYVVNG